MGRVCVLGCKFRKETGRKGVLFRVPKDARRRTLWEKSLQRDLLQNHYVCINHFTDKDIKKDLRFYLKDGSLLDTVPLKRIGLYKNAVPAVHPDFDLFDSSRNIPDEPKNIEQTPVLRLLSSYKLKIPSNWSVISTHSNTSSIMYATFLLNESTHSLVPIKEVCVTSTGNLFYNCYGQQIFDFDTKFKNFKTLEKIIERFQVASVCKGIADRKQIKESKNIYVDNVGRRRHELCPLLLEYNDLDFCHFCGKCSTQR